MNIKALFISFLCVFPIHANDVWIDPSNGQVEHIYIGAPGINASEAQFTRLTPQLTASTGEIIRCACGIHVVPETVIAQNLSEISLRDAPSKEALTCLVKTAPAILLALLGNRSGDTAKIVCTLGIVGCLGYALWRPLNFLMSSAVYKTYGITVEGEQEQQVGAKSIRQYAIDPSKINVAQDDDVNLYLQAVDKALTSNPDKQQKVILYGISRGSATVFNSFAKLDREGKSDQLGAIICEGIFDSVPNIIYNAPLVPRMKVKALLMLQGLTRFDKDGMSPLSMLEDITDKSKPIALISSKNDEMVPYKNTVNLYKELCRRGHTNVHLFSLEHATHNEYALGAEKATYQAFIHAFYRKYNLPYIATFADEGEQYLQNSQPAY